MTNFEPMQEDGSLPGAAQITPLALGTWVSTPKDASKAGASGGMPTDCQVNGEVGLTISTCS